ncbi:hypothetical protein B0H13DRAFT_2523010 [Mycena leptocephala]|nr:hypothetical protein B0H13DRAFT_2523010 [Mycena leptocephala]
MPESDKANTSRVAFNDKLFKASKGAVQAAAVALNIAASATQNVPYLGAISKVLVEVSKIIDEVTVCKAAWNMVMARVQEIQTVVDNFRDQCNREWRSEDELPEMIKQGFKDFEMCLLNVIVTMNDCKTTSKLQLLYKRSDLAAAANQCHKEVVSALTIFQAKLQIDQWSLQRDQGKVIHDIRNALVPHIPLLVKLNSTTSPPILPPAPAIFFGRSEEIDQLVDLILHHGPARVAIVGMGGIGKTSIALASIHHPDVQMKFPHRQFFLSCEAIFTADTLVLELLHSLAYLSHQSITSECLLCLDNFETPWDSDKDDIESLLANIAVYHLTLIITSRNSDRPRGIRWSVFKPIQPLTLYAAIETWDAISHGHDNFSIQLMDAVECLPLAVTLLAQLAETESSEALWASWNLESTRLVTLDGSQHRLSNLELSIELSLKSPRLFSCSGALDFFIILCLLPQGMSELRIPELDAALGKDFTGLRRVYIQSHQELSTPLTQVLLRHMTGVYLNLIPAQPIATSGAVKNIHLEHRNISVVLDICLPENDLALEKTIKFSEVCRMLGICNMALLSKARSIAHERDQSLEGNCLFEQGVLYQQMAKLSHAGQALRSALDIHKAVNDTLGQANDLQALGKLHKRLQQHQDAEESLRAAHDLHKKVDSRFGQANDLKELGGLYLRLGRLQDSKQALQSAFNLHEEIDDRLGQANDLKVLGDVYLRLGELDNGETVFRSALNLHKEFNDKVGQAHDLNRLGYLYSRLNRMEEAESSLQSALSIHKQVESKLGQGNDLQGLGELYKMLKRPDDSEQALQLALSLHKQVDDRLGQANDLEILGDLYTSLDRFKCAEEALQSAFILHKQVDSRPGQANVLKVLGELYLKLDRLEDAKETLCSALELHKEINAGLGQAYVLRELAKVYMRLNLLEDAHEALQSALNLHEKADCRLSRPEEVQNLKALFDILCKKHTKIRPHG